jgi:hypothetical protein
MQKHRCYYLNDFRDDYTASSEPDDDGDWYRVEDVDARIDELKGALRRSPCPCPIGDDDTAGACIDAGKCGCEIKSVMER